MACRGTECHGDHPGGEDVRSVGWISPGGFAHSFTEIADHSRAFRGQPDEKVVLGINERYGVYPAEGPSLI